MSTILMRQLVPAPLVTATAISSSAIQVTCPIDYRAASYKWYRDQIFLVQTTDPTYTDTGLGSNETHAYSVGVVDANGQEGPHGARGSSATTLGDTTAPTAPGTLTFASVTSSSFIAQWTAAADNVAVAGYEYSLDGATAVNVGATLAQAFSGLNAATPYQLRVRAYDAAGNRGPYLTATQTTSAGAGISKFFGATLPTPPAEFTTPTLSTAPTATGKGRYYTPGLAGSPDSAQSLQQCIDDSATQTGVNVIVLQAGTTYTTTTSFVLKPHAASWTYIISSDAPELVPFSGATGAGYASFTGGLPAAGTRVNNSANPITPGANDLAHMASMATSNTAQGGYIILQETGTNTDGITIAIANHYKFVGIDFSLTEANRPGGTGIIYYTVALFNSAGLTSGHNNLSWDRCHLAGAPTSGVQHVISCNAQYTEVTECYLWRCNNSSGGGDANLFFVCSSQGPYKLTNTYLECYSGEQVIIGGANIPNAAVNPTDIVIRGNLFQQNPTEVARVGGGKDFVEFKTGKRALIDLNYFGYSAFASPQAMIHLMTTDQTLGSNPWVEISDITITNNTIFGGIDNSGGLVGVYAAVHDPLSPTGFHDAGDGRGPCQPMKRIMIRNNLGYVPVVGSNIRASVISGSPFDCIWDHNTFITTGGPWGAALGFNDGGDSVATRFVYTNNLVWPDSPYGFWSAFRATTPLDVPGLVVDAHCANNVWGTPGQPIGGSFSNTYVANLAAIGFVDSSFATVGGCALSGSSPYKASGVNGAGVSFSAPGVADGSAIGANISILPTG